MLADCKRKKWSN